ncbi:hypothetical protein CL176_07320 [Suicoccus acidiformans]|uniref:Cell-wall binding lipoprotein n=1 Tax=Suicoccus acidiformans TaxID=2036206 RepID=A0A347WL64_9LACT|nr:YkyA family protein [Suicoccus acidiformans]AXY25821.1 hypothetical protein CL176_07320 [Suicoccus acidiformans]
MRKLIPLITMSLLALLLVACDNSLNRADRTITLVQDHVNEIINELNEIQLQEENLQADFEETLNQSEDLSAFKNTENKVYQNVQTRQSHLERLQELTGELGNLTKEFETIQRRETLPNDQVNQLLERINQLNTDMSTYVSDYLANLQIEQTTYQSIANAETDYNDFFGVFDNVNTLASTNQMNLEKVLAHFESINTQLINFKVFIANAQENR